MLTGVRKPSALKLPYEEIRITASDGVKLQAYLVARPSHILQNNEHIQKLALNFSVSAHKTFNPNARCRGKNRD